MALSSLDPRRVGPLTDAGATSYHAVKRALPKLVPGTTAVVIGAGGLGSYAVQFLRRLTGAQVIAVDLVPQRLEFARELGAHQTLASDDDTATRVRELTGGLGATAVFDFVGDDTTMKMALASAATLGTVAIVGAGGGTAKISWGVLPLECDFYIPMAASIADLHEVIALAEGGDLRVEVELFEFAPRPMRTTASVAVISRVAPSSRRTADLPTGTVSARGPDGRPATSREGDRPHRPHRQWSRRPRNRAERSGVFLSRPAISIISALHTSGPVRLSRLSDLTDLEAPLVSREMRASAPTAT